MTSRPVDDGPRPATARDVARLAGVSQSAVSRSFTGASVSPETRRRVIEAARQLSYRPNLIARSLITRRSGIVGVAFTQTENFFYAAMLGKLSRDFERVGYRVLLFSARPGESSDPVIDEVLRYHVDAIVLLSASLSSRFDDECQQAGVPVVMVNRRTESHTASSVIGENRVGAQTIARFLLAGGHQKFAFISGLENSSTSREREEGFLSGLTAAGFGPPLRVAGHYEFAAAAEATRTLLSKRRTPDAIFCANDHMALAAINVARTEFGIDVGRNISIVGFDDAGPAEWPMFDLTTYTQPIDLMVGEVVRITIDRLSNLASSAAQIVTPGMLVVRGSARLPPKGIVFRNGRRTWEPPRRREQ